MTNRSIIRLFSYAVCIVAVLAAYAVIGNNNSANYKALRNYQNALILLKPI